MSTEGRLTVFRGFTLTDHFRCLNVNQSCYVPLEQYSKSVIHSTLQKLKKEELLFVTKSMRKGKQPAHEIKVTRIQ